MGIKRIFTSGTLLVLLAFSGPSYSSCPPGYTGYPLCVPISSNGAVNPFFAPSVDILDEFMFVFFGAVQKLPTFKWDPKAGKYKKFNTSYHSEATSGLSAGDSLKNIGYWVNYSRSNFENDFFRTKFDGDSDNFLAGADFTPLDNVLLGVAVGYEDTDIDTRFNGGKANTDGWTIMPYFNLAIDEVWSFDASAGYSNTDTDQYRTAAGTRITSDVDTDRYFFSMGINGYTTIDRWVLSGRAGYMRAEVDNDNFTESNGTLIAGTTTDLAQISFRGEAAYEMGDFEPYVSAEYSRDIDQTKVVLTAGPQPSNDDNDVLLGLGLRYYGTDGLALTGELVSRQGRDDIDETALNFNVRWGF